MVRTPWSINELCRTLADGSRLPGEATGESPWPECPKEEFRLITAVQCIAEYFLDNQRAMSAICHYALHGDLPEVRCHCLTVLERLNLADVDLVDELLDDEESEIRCYCLEYLLVHRPERFPELEAHFQDDQDWFISETLAAFRAENEIPLFYYKVP